MYEERRGTGVEGVTGRVCRPGRKGDPGTGKESPFASTRLREGLRSQGKDPGTQLQEEWAVDGPPQEGETGPVCTDEFRIGVEGQEPARMVL